MSLEQHRDPKFKISSDNEKGASTAEGQESWWEQVKVDAPSPLYW